MEKRTQYNTNMLPSTIEKIKRLAATKNTEPGRYIESLVEKVKEPKEPDAE